MDCSTSIDSYGSDSNNKNDNDNSLQLPSSHHMTHFETPPRRAIVIRGGENKLSAPIQDNYIRKPTMSNLPQNQNNNSYWNQDIKISFNGKYKAPGQLPNKIDLMKVINKIHLHFNEYRNLTIPFNSHGNSQYLEAATKTIDLVLLP
jgi:hypothetical protein